MDIVQEESLIAVKTQRSEAKILENGIFHLSLNYQFRFQLVQVRIFKTPQAWIPDSEHLAVDNSIMAQSRLLLAYGSHIAIGVNDRMPDDGILVFACNIAVFVGFVYDFSIHLHLPALCSFFG